MGMCIGCAYILCSCRSYGCLLASFQGLSFVPETFLRLLLLKELQAVKPVRGECMYMEQFRHGCCGLHESGEKRSARVSRRGEDVLKALMQHQFLATMFEFITLYTCSRPMLPHPASPTWFYCATLSCTCRTQAWILNG